MSSIGPVYALCIEHLTGREDFVLGYGFSNIFQWAGSLVGPTIGGEIRTNLLNGFVTRGSVNYTRFHH